MSQVNVFAFWKPVSRPQSIATSQIHDQQVPVQTLIQTISWKCKKKKKGPWNRNNPCPPPLPPPVFMVCVSSKYFHAAAVASPLIAISQCLFSVSILVITRRLKPTMSKMSPTSTAWLTPVRHDAQHVPFPLMAPNVAVSATECTFTLRYFKQSLCYGCKCGCFTLH